MLKKLIPFLLLFSLLIPSTSFAATGTGACSGHDGVNCTAGPDTDGSVICNDGWTGSSVYYRDIRSVCTDDFRPFRDVVDTHPNYEAILTIYEKAIIIGYPDLTFKPDNPINRVEFLKILIEAAGTSPDPAIYNSCFPDVQSEWFAPYVCYAKEKGWVQGYEDGNFRPINTVLDVEAAKMLVETQGYYVPDKITKVPYTDVSLDSWYAVYVSAAKSKGLLEETGDKYNPGKNMTRAGITEMTYRAVIVNEEVLNSFDEYNK